MIYGRSKSSDMTFDSIKDSDGNELPISETLYEDRYEMAVDTEVRRKAYDSFIKTMNKYKNTYAATYATEITRSEEHTSELQSRGHLVCRLLLEKKK